MANKAYAEKNYPLLLKVVTALHELRPWNPDYMEYVVLANALMDNKAAAYQMMLQMQQQGLAADFNSMQDTVLIRETEAYEHINDLMVRAAEPHWRSMPTPSQSSSGKPPGRVTGASSTSTRLAAPCSPS